MSNVADLFVSLTIALTKLLSTKNGSQQNKKQTRRKNDVYSRLSERRGGECRVAIEMMRKSQVLAVRIVLSRSIDLMSSINRLARVRV